MCVQIYQSLYLIVYLDAKKFCTLAVAHTCRVLSALAHWSAIFGEAEYLPLLAFPFVKLFQNNPLICFEVVATVIGTHTEWFRITYNDV